MNLAEALPLLNILILPAIGYIIRMERRIFALETVLQLKLDALPCAAKGACLFNQKEAV